MTGYITVREASIKWGLGKRWVNRLCQQGKIPGVEKLGGAYAIPAEAECPTDGRVKTGAYKDWRKRYGKKESVLVDE